MYVFFFNDTATTEIYTLSLHDALPICDEVGLGAEAARARSARAEGRDGVVGALHRAHVAGGADRQHPRCIARRGDRKSTRLNSSHANISYAVFCLKKKTTR